MFSLCKLSFWCPLLWIGAASNFMCCGCVFLRRPAQLWVLGVNRAVGAVLHLPPSFHSLAAVVRWVSVQHLNPETAFNLRCGEAGPFWIVGFHNCQAAKPPPPPTENRESWEFNYDGILALDPAGLKRSLMGGLSFRTKTQEPPNTLRKIIILHYVQFALH